MRGLGGVINFITRDDYQGLELDRQADLAEAGGGNVYRTELSAGAGELAEDGENLMLALDFAASADWDPRVADPRLRACTLGVRYRFD